MPSMLIAYDDAGNVIGTLDSLVIFGEDGMPLGMADVEAIEAAGDPLRLRDDGTDGVWNVPGAAGSSTWPEWIGAQAHAFTVETAGEGRARRIVALVHKQSGHRRARAAVEDEIERRHAERRAEAAAKADEQRAGLPVERDERGRILPKPEVVVEPEPADLRPVIGALDRPLRVDAQGRTIDPGTLPPRKPLPLIGRPR